MKKYELIDHTADIGLRIFGRRRAELFENAGYGLFDSITDINSIACRKKQTFQLERENPEELLVEWLSGLLYLFDTEHFLFGSFKVVNITDTALIAEAGGEYFKNDKHSIKAAVKAVTYHNLHISKNNDVWEATVILDV